jgi:ADP-ribosylglycohydrolase
MAAMTGSITGARRGIAALPAELVESLVDGSERLAPTLTSLAQAVAAGLDSPDS